MTNGYRRRRQDLLVEAVDSFSVAGGGGLSFSPRAAGISQPVAQSGVCEESVKCRGQLLRLPRRDEQSSLTFDDYVGNAANARGCHGQACEHGFRDRHAEGFSLRSQRKDAHEVIKVRDVLLKASEDDAILQAKFGGEALQHLAIRTVAHDEQFKVWDGAQFPERADYIAVSLRVIGEPTGGTDDEVVTLNAVTSAERAQSFFIARRRNFYSVGYDRDLARRNL